MHEGMKWTYGMYKNANKKWLEATSGLRVNEMIKITCYTHHT
jgi:hypothetical protein